MYNHIVRESITVRIVWNLTPLPLQVGSVPIQYKRTEMPGGIPNGWNDKSITRSRCAEDAQFLTSLCDHYHIGFLGKG